MSLEKTLQELNKNSKRYSDLCAYMMLYNSLGAEDKKALDNAWAKNFPTSVIVRALRQEGHKTSTDSIGSHRRGECKCPKN
jgi:hypothetical protein